MPTFDYAAMATLALELLTEFGNTATIQRKQPTTLAADGSATADPDVPETVKCVEIVAGTRMGLANAGAQTDDGGTKNFSATHLIAPLVTPPVTGDTIVFNGNNLTIKDVRTVKPAGTIMCHFLDAGKP